MTGIRSCITAIERPLDSHDTFARNMIREVLSNGLTVVTDSLAHVRPIGLCVCVNRGSRDEEPSMNGIANLTRLMVMANFRLMIAKNSYLHFLPDVLSPWPDYSPETLTTRDLTYFYLSTFDPDLKTVIDVLAEIILNPVFEEQELERQKLRLYDEIERSEADSKKWIHQTLMEQFWPRQCLSRPILGRRETVEKITSNTLLNYFSDVYVASNIIVLAVGNLEHRKLRDLVSERLGPLLKGEGRKQDSPPRSNPGLVRYPTTTEPAYACLAFGVPGYCNSDEYSLWVLNDMLGESGISLLKRDVRDKAGLAHSIYSELELFRGNGLLTIDLECGRQHMARAIDRTFELLQMLKKVPLPAEVERSKNRLKAKTAMKYDAIVGRTSLRMLSEVYNGRSSELSEILAKIDRTTTKDVQRVARDFLELHKLGGLIVGSGIEENRWAQVGLRVW